MNEQPVLLGTMAAYAGAALGYATGWRVSARWLRWLTTAVFTVAFAAITAILLSRWVAAGRPPFKTLYESLLLFVWCCSALYLILERSARLPLIGAGAAALAAGVLAYALFKRDVEIVDLPPALQSAWFIPHVVVYFVGYGALALGALAAAVYLWRPAWKVQVRGLRRDWTLGYDQLMHWCVVVGFSMLTVGLLLGAVWAKQAWGDYWSWDPKENWALISWLTYGVYLHARRLPEWKGRRSAWLVLLGLAVIGFTYIGVAALPTADTSAHVYQ